MTLYFVNRIYRSDCRAKPEARFVFGDNLERDGLGGQAGGMRGEPNAIGVVTKRAPGMEYADFLYDGDPDALPAIDADIDRIAAALAEGRDVYVPADGLGTGLSELPKRAPQLYAHIVTRLRRLAGVGLNDVMKTSVLDRVTGPYAR